MSNVKTWATDTAVRAIKTAAQTAVAALGVNATGLLHVDWVAVGSLSGLAALTCVLQNLSNLNVNDAPAAVAEPVQAAALLAPAAPQSDILGKA